jgi:hypothetical protein
MSLTYDFEKKEPAAKITTEIGLVYTDSLENNGIATGIFSHYHFSKKENILLTEDQALA